MVRAGNDFLSNPKIVSGESLHGARWQQLSIKNSVMVRAGNLKTNEYEYIILFLKILTRNND
jgi:hypothetical protein